MRRDARWTRPVAAVGLSLAAAVAHGQCIAKYASTPVSPPAGFTWLPPVAAALFVALNTALLVALWGERRRRAVLRAVIAAGVFALAFYWFGRSVTLGTFSTSHRWPGLGWGHSVQWGLAHLPDARSLFVRWNVYGLLFLGGVLLVLLVTVRPLRLGRCGMLLAANAALYVVCALPYLLTGAYTHGGPYSYTNDNCQPQVARIAQGALAYAVEHDGRLPTSARMVDVFEELAPYIQQQTDRQERVTYCCPIGVAFDRDPEPYVWNAELSGLPIAETEPDGEPRLVIVCPYVEKHGWGPVVLSTRDLLFQVQRGRSDPLYPRYMPQIGRGMPFEELPEFLDAMRARERE